MTNENQPTRKGPVDRARAAAEANELAEEQARAYGELLAVYEARHDLLQPIRRQVLDRVLAGLDAGLSVLEVGCGSGACLALMADRGFQVEGIDLSPAMADAARARSGCPVTCADFLTHHFPRRYDLVFAQAFVHLFPKADFGAVIDKLKDLALRRVYFSTSLTGQPGEGWEQKDGVTRFRSRYHLSEFVELVDRPSACNGWVVQSFQLTDPLGKHWINVVMDRRR